jgi:hypothetical protein
MNEYSLKGQHTADRSMTRYKHDVAKMVENNEISTGLGRWALGAPNVYGNAAFVPNPTIRQQKWGASHDMSSTKTDVESDLLGLGRPSVRTVCGQFQAGTDAARILTPMPEVSFPRTYERLVDPPCTLRASGWNRWEWLGQDPQENVMMPFEHGVDSRYATRDAYLKKLTVPLERSQTAADHRFLCDELFVTPAVPVAKPQREGAPANFSDVVPGLGAGAREKVRSLAPRQQGPAHPDAPPRGPITEGRAAELKRADSGILETPVPFTNYMAPH